MEQNHEASHSNQCKEVLVIRLLPDAVIKPLTVVIEFINAAIALRAVFRLLETMGLAEIAEEEVVNRIRLRQVKLVIKLYTMKYYSKNTLISLTFSP